MSGWTTPTWKGYPTRPDGANSYTLTYDGNGGTGIPPKGSTWTTGGLVTIATAESLSKPGFEFDQWNTLPDGSGDSYYPNRTVQMMDRDITLFAIWKADYYILTYDGNFSNYGNIGAGNPPQITIWHSGDSVKISDKGSLSISNLSFDHWNTSPDGTGDSYIPNQSVLLTDGNKTLYAIWTDTIQVITPQSLFDASTQMHITLSVDDLLFIYEINDLYNGANITITPKQALQIFCIESANEEVLLLDALPNIISATTPSFTYYDQMTWIHVDWVGSRYGMSYVQLFYNAMNLDSEQRQFVMQFIVISVASLGISEDSFDSIAPEGTGSTTFYTVQSEADTNRLLNGGAPWPSEANRAALGEGVYAWGTRAEAENYLQIIQQNDPDARILEFSIDNNVLSQLNTINLNELSDEDAEAFMSQYSQLWGGTPNYAYDYIIRGTAIGNENYFSKFIFNLLHFDSN